VKADAASRVFMADCGDLTWVVVDSGIDARQLALTTKGEKALTLLGLDIEAARERRRQFACRCLDWSERRDHLGGALGAAIAEQFRTARWIERQKHSRVVRVTPLGSDELKRLGLRRPFQNEPVR
jgi:hypothetical protein